MRQAFLTQYHNLPLHYKHKLIYSLNELKEEKGILKMVTFDYKNGAIEHVFAKLFKLLIYLSGERVVC